MTRRQLLSLAAIPLAATPRRPNILWILADDLGYGDLGCYGGQEIPTPHLDRLAAQGIRFTDAYVSAPYCSPTRAGLLTGRYQQRFGHEFNAHSSKAFLERGGKEDVLGLPLSETTIAARLRDAGYTTGAIGKWHLGERPEFHPNRRGFDEFYGFLGGARQYVPGSRGVGPVEIQRNGQPSPWTGYLTDRLGEEAAQFIERSREKPWFLYLAFNAVHTPMEAPDGALARFSHIQDPRRRTYAAMLARLDDAIGAVLTQLSQTGQDRDTLVVFLGDNGGPTNKYSVNGSTNTPLRGSKGDTWEGGIRVPMIARWTGRLPAGALYRHPVIQLDLAATALTLATGSVPAAARFDGIDLLPHLTGRRRSAPHQSLFWRFGDHFAIRQGRWKAVHTWDTRAPQLYDLQSDLAETRDLASTHPRRLARLLEDWKRWNGTLIPPAWPRPDAIPNAN
ncbi:MAG: sulfatase [Acidobacteria bacterium]|nr:sulfatase [Acidobacteriota bacterium]